MCGKIVHCILYKELKFNPFCKPLCSAFWEIICHRAKSIRQEIGGKASFLPIPYIFWVNMDDYLLRLDFTLVPKMSSQSYF